MFEIMPLPKDTDNSACFLIGRCTSIQKSQSWTTVVNAHQRPTPQSVVILLPQLICHCDNVTVLLCIVCSENKDLSPPLGGRCIFGFSAVQVVFDGDGSMVRWRIGLKTHWSDGPLVRKPTGPKNHWSKKVSLVQKWQDKSKRGIFFCMYILLLHRIWD